MSGVYSQIVDTLFIYFDGYPWLWSLAGRMLAAGGLQGDHEVLQSIFFVTLTSIVGSLPGIPVDVYRTFVLEEKHGFNKTTPAIFITDMLKNWVLLFGLVSPFIYGFVKIIAWKGDGFIPYMMGFLWVLFISC